MSVDAGLEIVLREGTSVFTILRRLMDGGWATADEETLVAWTLGDEEHAIRLSPPFFMEATADLDRRLSRGESFAISMLYGASGSGGEFIFSSRDRIVFSPSIERRLVGDRMTDVSWYVARIVSAFTKRTDRLLAYSWTWQESA